MIGLFAPQSFAPHAGVGAWSRRRRRTGPYKPRRGAGRFFSHQGLEAQIKGGKPVTFTGLREGKYPARRLKARGRRSFRRSDFPDRPWQIIGRQDRRRHAGKTAANWTKGWARRHSSDFAEGNPASRDLCGEGAPSLTAAL